MKYNIGVFFKKYKLYNSLTKKLYLKINNIRINRYYNTLRELQIRDLTVKGRYCEVNIENSKFIFDRMSLHDYDMLSSVLNGHIYEPEVTKYIMNELMKGETFVDIGANNGYYTVLAAQLVGENGSVYSFEPNIDAFKRLETNIKLNNLTNVRYYNMALSDFNGTANLYLNKYIEDGSASLLTNTETFAKSKVTVKRFDEIFNKESREVSMMKMDVEGSEMNILKSLKTYLEDHQSVKIITEWNATYRTAEDWAYLDRNFDIFLLLWENNTLQKKKIRKFYEIPGWSNLLLIAK